MSRIAKKKNWAFLIQFSVDIRTKKTQMYMEWLFLNPDNPLSLFLFLFVPVAKYPFECFHVDIPVDSKLPLWILFVDLFGSLHVC